MKKYMSIKLSRSTLTYLAVFAAGITVLVIWILAMRKEIGHLSSSSQMNSQAQIETSRTQSSAEKICFVRGAWIYLANLVSGKEERLVVGVSPHLSPTGQSVVFISVKENEEIMNRLVPPAGRLRVFDLRTKEVRDFKALRDRRVGDPIWSNDGTKIAVTIGAPDRKEPPIAILDSGTGGLKKKISGGEAPSDDAIYLDSWTPDNRTLLFHTLRGLYEVHVDDASSKHGWDWGRAVVKWSLLCCASNAREEHISG